MTGYEAIHKDTAWLDLSSRGRLLVTGEDAGRLLHAMSTNDVKNLAEADGMYAFFLTAQGRILADAYIYRRGDAYFLDTEPETGEKIREHLDKYIIADDALVEHVEGWDEIGLEGPQSIARARELGLPVSDTRYGTEPIGTGFTARTASVFSEGIRVFAPAAEIAALKQKLTETGIPELGAEESRAVRIENGIPRYGEDISERYLVQETSQLQAVHFSKGCYLGQEIVERVRSRAQVHRHLKPVRIQSTVPPPPGTKLSREGKEVAEITSSAYSPALGEVVALAYLRTEALEAKDLVISGSDPAVSASVA